MHKNATKCNETLSKWCKNKHGASKIIDTFETYQPPTSSSSHSGLSSYPRVVSRKLIPSTAGYLGGSRLYSIVIASCTSILVQRMACDVWRKSKTPR
jgi:hypothetical protein